MTTAKLTRALVTERSHSPHRERPPSRAMRGISTVSPTPHPGSEWRSAPRAGRSCRRSRRYARAPRGRDTGRLAGHGCGGFQGVVLRRVRSLGRIPGSMCCGLAS